MERWVASCLTGLLLSASPCVAQGSPVARSAFPLTCTYASTSGELDVEEACASIAGKTPVLAPRILAKLSYTKGLAYFTVQGMAYHRRHDGTTRRMYMFDNGADYFVEGLARAIVAGKIAYVDRRLRIRIATPYDWGDRFDHGRAEVCSGCRSVPVGDGEHSVMEGGRWGMIDKLGREVVPVTLTQAEVVARRAAMR